MQIFSYFEPHRGPLTCYMFRGWGIAGAKCPQILGKKLFILEFKGRLYVSFNKLWLYVSFNKLCFDLPFGINLGKKK